MHTGDKMEPIVRLENVKKDYGQGDIIVHALAGVTLDIQPGEFVVMAGPSGSGKSTLLNVLGALERPTSGLIEIEGHDLSGLSQNRLSRLRRDRLGFVFQNYNLIPVLTAFENAEYVLMLQGVPKTKRKKIVTEILHEVGLEGMEHRFPSQLSGGQQQRVSIARALAGSPALILADEPTANLDSKTSASLMDMMAMMNEERGVTFLFATHDPALMRRAGRLIRLTDGLVSYDGAPVEEAVVA